MFPLPAFNGTSHCCGGDGSWAAAKEQEQSPNLVLAAFRCYLSLISFWATFPQRAHIKYRSIGIMLPSGRSAPSPTLMLKA